MRPFRRPLLLFACLLPFGTVLFASPLEGRWRLDPARSSALDGWTAWDLVISSSGTQVTLRYDMQWRSTQITGTNTVDTAQPTTAKAFFRVDQRHMAVYPEKDAPTPVRAAWLDRGRTLRVEAEPSVENSQGHATLRVYDEYRVMEGDNALVLIELLSARPRPLVYRFVKVTSEK